MAEANIKASLSVETVDALKKIVEIKQQLKETGALLAKAEEGGKFDSKKAEKYGLEIEKLNIALKEANKEFDGLSEKTSRFDSFKEVLSGIQGGFGAITGTLSLFGEKSEVVEAALEKVKAALEITEGIESIKKAVIAFKALSLSIAETGIGALVIGVVALIAYFKSLKESVDDAAKAQKLYDDIVKGSQNAYVNAQAAIDDLRGQIDLLSNNLESSEQFVENYNKGVGQVIGQVDNLGDAMKKLSDSKLVQAYIDAMYQREIATIAVGKAAENAFKIAELAAKQKQIQDKADEDKKNAKTTTSTYGGSMYSNPVTITAEQHKVTIQNTADADKKALQDQIDQFEKDNETIKDIAKTARQAEINNAKQYGLDISGVTKNNTQKVTTITKQGANDITENKRQALEQQLQDQLEGLNKQKEADIQIAADLGKDEEEIYNIQKRYQELKIQALEQYYVTIGDKNSKQALSIRQQVTAIVNEGIALDDKHIKAIFDAADAEIKKNFKNFRPPAEVAPPPPKSPEEIQREKDGARADANDAIAGSKISEKQDAFNKANEANKSPYQKYKQQLAELESFNDSTSELVKKGGNNELELKKYYSEAKKKLKKQEFDYELGLTKDLLSQASDLFGKNTVAGKVTAIAAATINTYLGATKALATLPPPFSYVSAALTIATGIKNIQSIVSTQVPGQAGTGGSAPSTPTSPIIPQVQQTNTTLNQDQLNKIGNATVRAFVLESDVSNNQEKIARLNRAARLGG